MRRSVLAVTLLFAVGAVSAAHADPVYDFTFTQNGNVLSFSMADPVPQRIAPFGEVELFLTGTGDLDGAPGAQFRWILYTQFERNFFIYLNPSEFQGYELPFLSRGPNLRDPAGDSLAPNSGCIDPCYDAVFHYIPGSYAIPGEFGPIDVTIVPQAGPASAAPEPGSLWLLSTGMLGAIGAVRGRLAQSRRHRDHERDA